MKPRMNFSSVCIVIAMVFGFASCSYDGDLQPPKRLLDAQAADNTGISGKSETTVTPVLVRTVKVN
jgi:hypothetical protein